MISKEIVAPKIVSAAGFVVSRKRKLYKFARFNELENCFQLEEWRNFVKNNPEKKGIDIVAEIGAGSALFLLEQAKKHTGQTFVAVGNKSDRLYQGARIAQEEKVNNIYFVRSRIEDMNEVFSKRSVIGLWLTFSDPYPRKSDERHRLTYKTYLKIYENILGNNGLLYLKTDDKDFFNYSRQSFIDSNWKILKLTRDLHGSKLLDEYKIMTTYESRFVKEGRKIYFFIAMPQKSKKI